MKAKSKVFFVQLWTEVVGASLGQVQRPSGVRQSDQIRVGPIVEARTFSSTGTAVSLNNLFFRQLEGNMLLPLSRESHTSRMVSGSSHIIQPSHRSLSD